MRLTASQHNKCSKRYRPQQQAASEIGVGGEAHSEGHPEKCSLTDVPHVGGTRRGLPNGQSGPPRAASLECLLGVKSTHRWPTIRRQSTVGKDRLFSSLTLAPGAGLPRSQISYRLPNRRSLELFGATRGKLELAYSGWASTREADTLNIGNIAGPTVAAFLLRATTRRPRRHRNSLSDPAPPISDRAIRASA